jgi:hypothetical protein
MRIAAVVVLIFMLGSARAQDQLSDIQAHQQRIDRVASAILASQARMLQAPSTMPGRDRAYESLNWASHLLDGADRDLTALQLLLNMQQLVSGDSKVQLASRIVEIQRGRIRAFVAKGASNCEEMIKMNKDQETVRLLFEARDAIAATSDLLQRP